MEEVPVEKLNILRDALMSKVISQLDGALNPKPAYNSGVYFEHSRFCEDCIDKVSAAIKDGLRIKRSVVSREKEDKMEEAITSTCPSEKEEDAITRENARLVAKTLLYKLNLRVNDHVSLEFFNREGMKMCLERDSLGGLPYEVARVVDRYGYDGKYAISEKLLGQHTYAATKSTGIIYDEHDQKPIIKLSDHSGLTIGEVLSKATGNGQCSCMQSERFKNNERKNVEELVKLTKSLRYNRTPYNGYDTEVFKKIDYFCGRGDEDDENWSVSSSEDDFDSGSKEKEEPVADDMKCRIVNDDFRPSRSFKAESERGDAPPLCLSICRHLDGKSCPFNVENKRKIFNAVNFVKEEREEEKGDGRVVVPIDGEQHRIEICTTDIPSFAIGSSIYEVLVYDHDPSPSAPVSSSSPVGHGLKTIVAAEVSECKDEQEGTRMSEVTSVLCDQIFAKPCAKAYLTVTTAAVPWPGILKTPPMSDVSSEGKYGSYMSFVVPLPCSYGGRRLNDATNGWRSKVYSNYVEDFVNRAIRPLPKSRLLDLSGCNWNFPTLYDTHHQLKVFGSVLRSECGDLDPSPLEYKASTSLCSRDAVEAQSALLKLRRLLDTCKKDLDTFTGGPYREATITMKNLASEIEHMEQNSEHHEEYTGAKALLEKQFEEQKKCVVFMSELATKQNNFKLQLERQLNNLTFLCTSFITGF